MKPAIPPPNSITSFNVEAPTADSLTAYDEAHMAIYMSLLYAEAEGSSAEVMCRDILGIDLDAELDRAKAMLQSHLDRAHWLSTTGRHRILEG